MPAERSSGPQRRCNPQAASRSAADGARPLDPGGKAVPLPRAGPQPEGRDRQAGEQHAQGARRDGHRRSQRDQAAHRQGADQARHALVGEQGPAAGEHEAEPAQHRQREQRETEGRPGHAVRQRAARRRRRPGLRCTTSTGAPGRVTRSVPGTAWAGVSTTVQRAARERGETAGCPWGS